MRLLETGGSKLRDITGLYTGTIDTTVYLRLFKDMQKTEEVAL